MNKTLDKWESVLLALYASAIGGRGFRDVDSKTMEMDSNEFGWTLYVLQMRGMIEGCKFQPARPGEKGQLLGVMRDNLLLTPKGFEKAEEMLTEQNDDGRLREARTILENVGCGIMANIISKIIQL